MVLLAGSFGVGQIYELEVAVVSSLTLRLPYLTKSESNGCSCAFDRPLMEEGG